MMFMSKRLSVFAPQVAFFASFFAKDALAGVGQPEPWQIWLQPAGSPVMEKVSEFTALLTIIEIAIVIFVFSLMAFILVRFNAKANPVPSKATHNTMLEVVWTAVPILILLAISIPSLKILYYMDRTQEADMTIKVIGHQWYWSYEYPDHGDFTFDSMMVLDEDLQEGQPRLLAVDNEVILPVGANVRILLTSDDVIHNWAVPSLGLKTGTIPGRTNETWVNINEEGVYYGQCSELCGINHAFMPVAIRAVSKEAFDAWALTAKVKFAKGNGDNAVRVSQLNAPMKFRAR
jgi:cytochrome c oxidase subunit II